MSETDPHFDERLAARDCGPVDLEYQARVIAEYLQPGIELVRVDDTLEIRSGPAANPDTLQTIRQQQDTVVREMRQAGLVSLGQPASERQRRVWFTQKRVPGDVGHNLCLCFRIEGTLEREPLQAAVDRLVLRHDLLRATFHHADGQLCHVVSTRGIDVGWSAADTLSDAEANARFERCADRPFDLEGGPLFRVEVIQLADRAYLGLFAHHVVVDYWSFRIISDELFADYRAQIGAAARTVAKALARTYRDLVDEEQADLPKGAQRAGASYAEINAGAAAPKLAFPPGPGGRDGAAGVRDLVRNLSPEAAAAVRARAAHEGTTPYVILASALTATLHRVYGQDDVQLCTSTMGRSKHFLPVVGHFSTVARLRSRRFEDHTFKDLVHSVTEQIAAIHQIRMYPHSLDAGGSHRTGLGDVQVMFVWHKDPRKRPDIGLPYTLMPVAAQRGAPFELSVYAYEHAGAFSLRWNFDSHRIEAHALENLAESFETVVMDCATSPERKLSDVALVGPRQERWLAKHASGPDIDLTAEDAWHRVVLRRCEAAPNAVAVRGRGGDLTYADLAVRAHAAARAIAVARREGGRFVSVEATSVRAQVVGMLGAALSGAAYLPIDPNAPAARRFQLLEAGDPICHITDGAAVDGWPCIMLTADGALVTHGQDSAAPISDPVPELDNLVYLLFTSGTTGAPKGVMVTHRSLANYLKWAEGAYALGKGTALSVLPATFDASITTLLLPLYSGGAIVETDVTRAAQDLVGQLTYPDGYGLLKLTPAHLRLVGSDPRLAASGCRADVVVVGGEALTPAVCRTWAEVCPGSRIINEYGPTETVVGCCIEEADPAEKMDLSVPIGRPIGNTTLRVIDTCRQLAVPGAVGELYIGGAGVAAGYLNAPEETAAKFVTDPIGGRMFRSGDLVRYLPDGRLSYLGRRDQQLKIRGHRVDPAEIEEAICRHPTVSDCAVIGRTQQGETHLDAYVVAEDTCERAVLSDHLKGMLPLHMLPSRYLRVPGLPLTPQGKVDRGRLPDLDGTTQLAGSEDWFPPRNDTERQMLDIWKELLGDPALGVRHDFFENGGTSITIAGLYEAYERHFPGVFEIADLFSNTTIERQAKLISGSIMDVAGQQPGGIEEIEF